MYSKQENRTHLLMFVMTMANMGVFVSMLFIDHSKAGMAELVLGTIVVVYSLYGFGFRRFCDRLIFGATYLMMTGLINVALLAMLIAVLLGNHPQTI